MLEIDLMKCDVRHAERDPFAQYADNSFHLSGIEGSFESLGSYPYPLARCCVLDSYVEHTCIAAYSEECGWCRHQRRIPF